MLTTEGLVPLQPRSDFKKVWKKCTPSQCQRCGKRKRADDSLTNRELAKQTQPKVMVTPLCSEKTDMLNLMEDVSGVEYPSQTVDRSGEGRELMSTYLSQRVI